jgi:predicted RNase H-like HicB family nuclease
MHNEFTALVERDGPWFVAYCAEVPGANGQGKSREECLANLREAIALILEHRREESLRALPPDARQELLVMDEAGGTPPAWLRAAEKGKEHRLWENPQTGHAEAVPRHTEIATLLAKRICRKLSIPEPSG